VNQPAVRLSFTVIVSAALASCFIALLLGISLNYAYLISSFTPAAQYISKLTAGDIDLRSERLAAISKSMALIDNLGCNTTSLSLMRSYVANSIGFFDIGLLDAENEGVNELNCSAMGGVIRTEFFRSSPIIRHENGAKLWNSYNPGEIAAHPRASGVNNRSAYAYRHNQFIYFIEPLPIQSHPPRVGEWEVVYSPSTPMSSTPHRMTGERSNYAE
jgi:hypothetical protein